MMSSEQIMIYSMTKAKYINNISGRSSMEITPNPKKTFSEIKKLP